MISAEDCLVLLEMADEWERHYRYSDSATWVWFDASAQLRGKIMLLGESAC